MPGFFNIKSTSDSSGKIDRSKRRAVSCAACGLYKSVLSPRMEAFGKGKKGILVIGEAPGEVEDKKGQQWQGPVGRSLQQRFKKLGFSLFRDCVCINSINCRPTKRGGGNRSPSSHEIDCCRPRVWKVIQRFKPKVILLLGGQAVQSFLGHRWRRDLGGISKWRGWTIPDREVDAWVCPMFHPSFVERSDRNKAVEVLFERDLERALKMTDVPFPKFVDESELIRVMEDDEEILRALQKLIYPRQPKVTLISLDYETTGIKPHTAGHRIVCGAVALYPEGRQELTRHGFPRTPEAIQSLAFITPTEGEALRSIKIFLEFGKQYIKTAHNAKFEISWSRAEFGVEPQGFVWDSMLAAHVLDNRDGITSLKFQAYVQFGVLDYDSHINPFLKSTERGGNGFNRVEEFINGGGRQELLEYCGLDSIYGLMLTLKQREEILWKPLLG